MLIDNILCDDLLKLKDYYLKHYEDFNENCFVFGCNKNISFTNLERMKNYYCKKANVKQITIHEFRHSHACLLFKNNVPIEDVSHRLGHSTISMTMDVYLKYLPHNEKRVISTLNSIHT
ncbi:MAG: tyrosine-type recombinase/integrase [Bacilli bacterium]|nr:tyrosine-type recombinase/integrase [Bacilli bacterium]